MSDAVRLLIVDDEPDVPALMRQLLRRQVRAGELVLSFADNGENALHVLHDDPTIDIVLTDINMPRMDGLTLLGRIGDLERTLKAVVVTAYGDMQNIRTAMNRGAFDFLTKPINIEDLTITIRKAAETVYQQRRAERLRATFGLYVSKEVVDTLLETPDATELGGEKREVTILMSDLRGFSMLAENRPPEVVVEILNIYLGAMTDVITDFGGTVSEFIGDGILALFGAPIRPEDHADRAVACALAMQNAMVQVRRLLEEKNLPWLSAGMGIGIHTGEVVVGNIGSSKRMKYTPVGSNVNLASRVESFTVGGQVLISQETLDALKVPVRVGRTFDVSVKGFSSLIPLHDVEHVGEPFDLTLLPLGDSLIELSKPLNVQVSVLDGKHLTAEAETGRITHLAPSAARLETERALARLDNVKIRLMTDDGSEELGECYAKVWECEEGAAGAQIRFTAVPNDVAGHFRNLLPAPQS